MEAVRHEGHGVGEVADDDLDEEEGGGEAEHAHQPAFLPRELALPPPCALTHLAAFPPLSLLCLKSPLPLSHVHFCLLFLWPRLLPAGSWKCQGAV